jgi:hypothetical protein
MKYIWDAERQEFVPKERKASDLHYVQGDLEEFRNTDGTMIGGRRQWREHLKSTDTIEMTAKDLQLSRERWNSRKADFQDRIRPSEKSGVRPVNVDVMSAPDPQASLIQREVMNRLDGRPTPERKMLIKMTLDAARMLRGR